MIGPVSTGFPDKTPPHPVIIANRCALIKVFLENSITQLLAMQNYSEREILKRWKTGLFLSGHAGRPGIDCPIRVKCLQHIGDGCFEVIDIAALFNVDFPFVET